MRAALGPPLLVALSFLGIAMRRTVAAFCGVAAGSPRGLAAARSSSSSSSGCALLLRPSSAATFIGSRRGSTTPKTTTLVSMSSLSTSSSSASGRSTAQSRRSDDDDDDDDPAQAAHIIMQHALFRVRDVNRKAPDDVTFLDFVVDGTRLGKVSKSNADLLVGCGENVFTMGTGGGNSDPTFLTFTKQVDPTFDARTEAVASVTDWLRQDGHLPGWRNELYPVSQSFYDPPVFAMERAAVPWIGAIEYGVHVNGLVFGDDNSESTKMWMARRSSQKSKFPGMLDHVVAGGQPLGMSLLDNVIKECHEEAGISEHMARAGLKAASAISYETYVASSQIVSRAVLFNYDLYLPSSFVPIAVDGEVDEFFLWTVEDLLASLDPHFHDPIKPNCYSVIIDYLVRHGHLSPDTPGYLDVVRELRSGECR